MTAQYLMVTDARIGSSPDGRPASPDEALSGSSWKRGLDDLRDVDWAVRVNPEPGSGVFEIDGDVVPLPYYVGLGGFIRSLPRLLSSIDKEIRRHEVIITRLPGLIGLTTIALARIRRKPVAVELVGDVEDALRQGRTTVRHACVARLAGGAVRMATKQANSLRYVTDRTLQEGYPAKFGAVVVSFSSVRLGTWLTAPRGEESPLPTVIAIGSHQQWYKGHQVLLRALPTIREEFPSVRLVLVGDGRFNQDLRQLAVELGVSESVEFAGYVRDVNALVRMVDDAWIYALPSLTEGMPRSLIEAMARERACVASTVGGVPELLSQDQLVPPGQAQPLARQIISILKSADARSKLGSRNREYVQRFSPSELDNKAKAWATAVQALRGSRT